MKMKSGWKIVALSCALVIVASSVAMYSSADVENGISDSEEEVIHASHTNESDDDTNKTDQSKTNQTTIPLEKPPFVD